MLICYAAHMVMRTEISGLFGQLPLQNMTWTTHYLHFYAVYICEQLLFVVFSCLSVCMCVCTIVQRQCFLFCMHSLHMYIGISKEVNPSSGSLSMACWRVPSMVDASTTPLTSASYAPTWSSSSLHISFHPPSQLVTEKAEEDCASFQLRSASQTLAPYWQVSRATHSWQACILIHICMHAVCRA